jgi:hypothetical protein
MKAWTAIGAIFVLIGTVLLIAGFAHASEVISTYNQIGLGQFLGSQVESTLFWSAFEPYLIGSVITLIVGGVGFYAGGSSSQTKIENTSYSTTTYSMPPPPNFKYCVNYGTMLPDNSKFCNNCGKSVE